MNTHAVCHTCHTHTLCFRGFAGEWLCVDLKGCLARMRKQAAK